jgi:hypothetical protein
MPAGRSLPLVFAVASVLVQGQPILSLHSGLVQYFEGSVAIDGKAVRGNPGRFPEIPEASSLRTEDGQAEVLLAPGVFLWLGPHSGIAMIQNRLTDAIVELLEGSAVVRSVDPLPDTSVTMIYGGWKIGLVSPAFYRTDFGASQPRIYDGQVEVSRSGQAIPIETDRTHGPADELDRWVNARLKAIVSANVARTRMTGGENSKDRKKSGRTRAYQSVPPPMPRRTW